MKMKSMMLLAVASGCGLLAMFLFQQAKGSTPQEVQKVQVLYAITEITPGTLLDDTNVEFREIPIDMAPDTAVTTPEEYKDRASKVRLFKDDVITLDKLGGQGASGDIPEGMVAVPIPVDTTMILGGLLVPGDRVDVLVTYRAQNALGKTIKTVLEFVEVFATDANREIENPNGESDTRTVTLLVTAKQALLVKLAEDVGKLHLTMRSKQEGRNKTPEERKFKESDVAMFHQMGGDDDDDDDNGKPDKQTIREQQAQMAAAMRAAAALDAASARNRAKAPEPKPEPKPKWQVEIYAGEDKRVDEFELDVPKKDEAKGKNPLLNTLNSLFGSKPAKRIPVTDLPKTNYDQEESAIPTLPIPPVKDDSDAIPPIETPETDSGSDAGDSSEPPIPFPVDR